MAKQRNLKSANSFIFLYLQPETHEAFFSSPKNFGESLPSGANRAPDARLDIHARGFWERQRSAFFDARVCYPNADSYRDLDLKQIS